MRGRRTLRCLHRLRRELGERGVLGIMLKQKEKRIVKFKISGVPRRADREGQLSLIYKKFRNL